MVPGPVPPWFEHVDPKSDILPQFSKISPKNHVFFNIIFYLDPNQNNISVPYIVLVSIREQKKMVLKWFLVQIPFHLLLNGSGSQSMMDPDWNRPIYNPSNDKDTVWILIGYKFYT